MGGSGSGNWYRWRGKKATVEESLAVDVKEFRGRLYHGSAGTLSWTWAGGDKASIGYFVTVDGDASIITLHYRWRKTEDVSIPVRLTTTRMQFGGKRWWFVCPLIVRGVACNRRVRKLYSPPGSRYFGCRRCHDLTYRSSQEAHRDERLFANLGFGPDVARMMRTLGRNR